MGGKQVRTLQSTSPRNFHTDLHWVVWTLFFKTAPFHTPNEQSPPRPWLQTHPATPILPAVIYHTPLNGLDYLEPLKSEFRPRATIQNYIQFNYEGNLIYRKTKVEKYSTTMILTSLELKPLFVLEWGRKAISHIHEQQQSHLPPQPASPTRTTVSYPSHWLKTIMPMHFQTLPKTPPKDRENPRGRKYWELKIWEEGCNRKTQVSPHQLNACLSHGSWSMFRSLPTCLQSGRR